MTTINGIMVDAEGTLLDGFAVFTPTSFIRDGSTLVTDTPVRIGITAGVVEDTEVRATDATWRYLVQVFAVEPVGSGRQAQLKLTMANVQVSGAAIALSDLTPALPPIEESNAQALSDRITVLEGSHVVDASTITTGTLDPARIGDGSLDRTKLSTAVQTSLGMADTATQPAQLQAAIDALVGAAPGALDTLEEVAAALADDDTAIGALSSAIAAKYAKPAGGIPGSDLAIAVQTSLSKAETAVQPADLGAPVVVLGPTDPLPSVSEPTVIVRTQS